MEQSLEDKLNNIFNYRLWSSGTKASRAVGLLVEELKKLPLEERFGFLQDTAMPFLTNAIDQKKISYDRLVHSITFRTWGWSKALSGSERNAELDLIVPLILENLANGKLDLDEAVNLFDTLKYGIPQHLKENKVIEFGEVSGFETTLFLFDPQNPIAKVGCTAVTLGNHKDLIIENSDDLKGHKAKFKRVAQIAAIEQQFNGEFFKAMNGFIQTFAPASPQPTLPQPQ